MPYEPLPGMTIVDVALYASFIVSLMSFMIWRRSRGLSGWFFLEGEEGEKGTVLRKNPIGTSVSNARVRDPRSNRA